MMKQMKKTNRGWKFLSILPLAGLLTVGLGFAGTAHAGPIILNPALPTQPVGSIAPQGRPDLQVRVWVDARSVHQNANHTYNFTIRGELKNVGNANFVSRRNQQVLFLHQVGRSQHITNWPFSRLNRGQVMKVHVPVTNQPGGEFVPAYELALSFDPDIYTDRNPANDDRNRRNNQATVSSRTLSAAFARAAGGVRGVHVPGVPVGQSFPHVLPRGGKPDLTVQVINAQRGLAVIKNVGLAAAPASKLSIICSRLHSRLPAQSCVADLHLPNYDARYNSVYLNIPALRPGASHRVNVWGRGTMPLSAKVPDSYGIKLFIDPFRRIAESNERNNFGTMDFTVRQPRRFHPPRFTPRKN